jgi:hypothetical protein
MGEGDLVSSNVPSRYFMLMVCRETINRDVTSVPDRSQTRSPTVQCARFDQS